MSDYRIDWINRAHRICELAYPTNVGLMEMLKFYQVATPQQIDQMERIAKRNDWEGFKKLIAKVLGVNLQ